MEKRGTSCVHVVKRLVAKVNIRAATRMGKTVGSFKLWPGWRVISSYEPMNEVAAVL